MHTELLVPPAYRSVYRGCTNIGTELKDLAALSLPLEPPGGWIIGWQRGEKVCMREDFRARERW